MFVGKRGVQPGRDLGLRIELTLKRGAADTPVRDMVFVNSRGRVLSRVNMGAACRSANVQGAASAAAGGQGEFRVLCDAATDTRHLTGIAGRNIAMWLMSLVNTARRPGVPRGVQHSRSSKLDSAARIG